MAGWHSIDCLGPWTDWNSGCSSTMAEWSYSICDRGTQLVGRSASISLSVPNLNILFFLAATYRANIRNAMIHISTLTCIKFVERKSETDYVRITNGATGCWSYIGRIGGGQIVNLQSSAGCALMGVAAHELLHAIGFHHAQSDINRNQYVRVNYENVVSGQEHNFEMYSNNYVSDYGEGYDFGSILHYSRYAFSKNGKTTIDPLVSAIKCIRGRNTFNLLAAFRFPEWLLDNGMHWVPRMPARWIRCTIVGRWLWNPCRAWNSSYENLFQFNLSAINQRALN